jgi:hypothetical protein
MKLKMLFLTILALTVVAVNGQIIHPWEVYTLSFRSGESYSNPYKDIPLTKNGDLLKVTFKGTGEDGIKTEITVIGFWNGGSEWCVNFTPPLAGNWEYMSFSTDRSMNGKKGNIKVIQWSEVEKIANPVRNGFVRVNKAGDMPGHYFEYTDGQPFLWIGDTWWNWTDSRIHLETFKQLVDDRAVKGFNVGQLFVPGNGWGRESSLLDETYNIPDVEHIKKVEEMIRYANSKGITVWVHGWWSRPNMNSTIGAEKIERWWRYLVHRFGAYNVIWVLAGEYNMNNYGGFSPVFWKDLGKLIKDEDPYERIISVHNTPPFWDGGAEAPQWSTGSVLHQETWLDYNQSQVGHGKFANEMIPFIVSEDYNRKPSKPIVVTESWYEFIEGSASAMDIRFAAWSAILSGAAGHTYGGGHVWLASVPESPADERTWPLDRSFSRTTYDYAGAVSMKYLAAFFKNVKWWKMSPHPEFIMEYPQPFCLANLDEEYIIYLRYGGVAKVKMDESAASNSYYYQWYNPATGKLSEKISVKGSAILTLSCPESYPGSRDFKDWVLYIKRE